MNRERVATITDPLIERNPLTVHVLGICSALAVTNSVATAFVMSAALTVVLVISNLAISSIRRHIPVAIRLIVQIVIIAALVIVADEFLKVFAFELSKQLSVYVSLIVTNCIVLAHAESYAMHNPPLPSALDGLGNGLGYTLILVPIGALRELLGAGSLLGYTMLPIVRESGWFEPLAFIQKPAAAFVILGLAVWLLRAMRPAQAEKADFRLQPGTEAKT